MRDYLILFVTHLYSFIGLSQNVQTINGYVVDKTSKEPLLGATVFIRLESQDSTTIGTVTETDGRFALTNVPVGRHIVYCTYVGYEKWLSRYIEVTSAKQIELEIELSSTSSILNEITVSGRDNPNQASNEFSLGSARSFTADETQRYAGSINDPGRMALSLPGTQVSNQDNENTIVVRANSPIGLSWRLEGVEIPNPNHFAEAGSSGGGVSALSIYMLGTSDFFTGSFPAEFGNATAGVIDLKFRKGSRENRESRIQTGLIGLDFASEGPFSKKKKNSSYLFNYRYSTLGLLSSMGVNVVNPLTANTFQDLSFNLHFPINSKTIVTVFGVSGISSEIKKYQPDLSLWTRYNDVSPYSFSTRVGVVGSTYRHAINQKSFLYGVISLGGNYIEESDDTVATNFAKTRILNEHYLNGRLNTAWTYTRNFSENLFLKTGIQMSSIFYDVFKEDYFKITGKLRPELRGKNQTTLVQPFGVIKAAIGQKIVIQGGATLMYFDYTKELLVEPRLGVQYKVGKGTLGLSYGLHSQILPFAIYEAIYTDSVTGNIISKPNQNLRMWRAHHTSLSFNRSFKKNLSLKAEPYYQYLFNIPVSKHSWNTYSLINQDRNFLADSLISNGTAVNAGLELTLEKTFGDRFFFLLSAAAYTSTYKTNNGGSDRTFNTKYNSGFNSAITCGKEWNLGNAKRIEVGFRVLWSGGPRYTSFNALNSVKTGRPQLNYSETYAYQVKNYFRVDTRIALRKNLKRISWRLSLDIQNLTDSENPQRPYFDRWLGKTEYQYNTSIIPVISYVIDF